MTRQSDGVLTNINDIVAKYQKTGLLTHLNHQPPAYGDFSMAHELDQALNVVIARTEDFENMPSAVREAAGNDPVRFYEMLATEEGRQIIQEAGLAIPDQDEPERPANPPERAPEAPSEAPSDE